LSGNQEDPITSIEKKGKEEIYLGLEIAAVTEYPTHDEDGGLVKKKEERDEGICLAGGEGCLYMYTNQANIKSSEHQSKKSTASKFCFQQPWALPSFTFHFSAISTLFIDSSTTWTSGVHHHFSRGRVIPYITVHASHHP
jgi:hypothetical protein